MKRLLTLNFLAVILFASITSVLFYISIRDIQAVRERYAKDQQIRESARKIQTVQEQLVLAERIKEEVAKQLVSEKDINNFFTYLNTLDTAYGVTHSFVFGQSGGAQPTATTSPSSSAPSANNAGELPLIMTVNGPDHDTITKFLIALETGRYPIKIKEVTLATSNGAHRAQVEFILYVSKAN